MGFANKHAMISTNGHLGVGSPWCLCGIMQHYILCDQCHQVERDSSGPRKCNWWVWWWCGCCRTTETDPETSGQSSTELCRLIVGNLGAERTESLLVMRAFSIPHCELHCKFQNERVQARGETKS